MASDGVLQCFGRTNNGSAVVVTNGAEAPEATIRRLQR